MNEIKQLNAEILESHNAHYKVSPKGLINPDLSPNENQIYHLYSTGEITAQKGGWAYLERSEFTLHHKLTNFNKLNMEFVNKALYGSSYVILTEEECVKYRNKMFELIK